MKVDLEETFGKRIKIDPKVRTISGVFFSKENLEQTDYRPAYQRNYVWDDEKASYFIESIFLGTEIPPLIYFKTEKDDEIKKIPFEIIKGGNLVYRFENEKDDSQNKKRKRRKK